MEKQRPASASKRPRMKRIFKNPNPLFMRWLSEWKREADEKESKMRHTYKICMQSLKQFPLPLTSGKSCAILKGFGTVICARIDKKLEEYVQQHGSLPFSGGAETTDSSGSLKINGASSKSPKKRVVQTGACRSGPGVAASTLLLAMRTLQNSSCSQIQGWCKRDILSAARGVPIGSAGGTPDNAALAGSTDPYRTLWNYVSALVKQDLVEKVPGKPVRYRLTSGGRSSADQLVNDQRCRTASSRAGLICPDLGRSQGCDSTDNDSPVTQSSAGMHQLSDSEPDSEAGIRTERLTADESQYGGDSDDDLPDLATPTSQLSQPMGSTGVGHVTPTLTSRPIGDDVIVVSSDSDCDLPVKIVCLQEEWSARGLDEQGGAANSHGSGVRQRDPPPPHLAHLRLDRCPFPSRPVHPQSKRQCKPKSDASAGGSTFNNRQEDVDCSQLLARITSIQSHSTAPYSSQSAGIFSRSSSQSAGFSAPHSSQSAGVSVPHLSQSAGVSAPHSSQSAGVSAPHSSQSAGISAPHSSQSAGVSVPHSSQSAGISAQHSSLSAGVSAPHLLSSAVDVSSVDSQPLCRLAAGTFDIVLCVDTQETSGGVSEVNDRSRASRRRDVIISELQKSGLLTDIRRLSIGDFLWVARSRTDSQCDELVLPWVIERKRLDDLAASIRGSRYKEQKYRLQQCGLTNVVYLAEGMGTNKKQLGLPESSLQQALANCQAADGFLVQRTSDQRSTADYLIALTRSLCQQYQNMDLLGCRREDLAAASTSLSTSLWTSFSQQQERLMTFSELQQRSSKRQRLTVSDKFARMLLQLHGLSTDKARAIVDAYPTPALLAAAYRSCSSPAHGEALLSQLRCPRSKRPVGSTISRVLYNLYTSEELA